MKHDEALQGYRFDCVIDLLNRRIEGRAPGTNDGRKLALIVEGGAMRGVLSAGSLLALDLLGCRDVFDEVYAVSAGAVNAAYFLSGQGELGISVYFDDISSMRFANPFRIWKIIDVDYVYDHVVPHLKSLDEGRIRDGRSDFFLGLTDVRTGNPVMVDVKKSPHPVSRLLKASSAIPVLYNRTVRLGDDDYIDGGISDVLPVAQAIQNGCTDVLILTTRLPDHVSNPPPIWERLLFFSMMGWRYPGVQRAYDTNFSRTSKSRAYASGSEVLHSVNIATIGPTVSEPGVGRSTRDRDTLLHGAWRMALRTAGVVGRPSAPVDAAFQRLSKSTLQHRSFVDE